MGAKLRWGILGSARIIRKTIPALQESANGEVTGIASRSQEKSREIADKFGIPEAFGSYEALLASPLIDAVYVPLPNALHLEWILKSLDAGKHVLCEKPLAMSADECEQIARKAEETGLKVLEGFMYRFHPRFEKLQELLESGAVGILTFAHVVHTFAVADGDNIRWHTELGGGALFDTGGYCVNAARMVTGQEPNHVSAYGNYRDSPDGGRVDTSMAGMLRFPDGATVLFDTGVNLERRNSLEVTGTAGRLYLHNPFGLLEEDSVIEEHHFGHDVIRHEVPGQNHFVRMFEHFADSVLNGTPLRYDLQDAAYNARVLEALDRTAREHSPLD